MEMKIEVIEQNYECMQKDTGQNHFRRSDGSFRQATQWVLKEPTWTHLVCWIYQKQLSSLGRVELQQWTSRILLKYLIFGHKKTKQNIISVYHNLSQREDKKIETTHNFNLENTFLNQTKEQFMHVCQLTSSVWTSPNVRQDKGKPKMTTAHRSAQTNQHLEQEWESTPFIQVHCHQLRCWPSLLMSNSQIAWNQLESRSEAVTSEREFTHGCINHEETSL